VIITLSCIGISIFYVINRRSIEMIKSFLILFLLNLMLFHSIAEMTTNKKELEINSASDLSLFDNSSSLMTIHSITGQTIRTEESETNVK
jgi:hypothetical protein